MNTANTSNGEIASMTNVSCQPLTKAIVTPAMNVAKNLCNKKKHQVESDQIKSHKYIDAKTTTQFLFRIYH